MPAPPAVQSVHVLCHVQDKYVVGNQNAQHHTNGSSVPAAKGERLADVSFAESASGFSSPAVSWLYTDVPVDHPCCSATVL